MRVEEGCVFRERFRLQWGVEFSVRMLEKTFFFVVQKIEEAPEKKLTRVHLLKSLTNG